jgi:hypothetical protein
MAAIASIKMGRHFVAATQRRRGDKGEPSLDARVELARRGTRRAVLDFWGHLHGFT